MLRVAGAYRRNLGQVKHYNITSVEVYLINSVIDLSRQKGLPLNHPGGYAW